MSPMKSWLPSRRMASAGCLGSWAASLLVLLALCAMPAWAQSPAKIPAFDSPVVDTTGTLDAATKQQLEQQALALQEQKGSQLQVLMIPSTQPEDIEAYAVRAFESFKLGRKGVDDGVLLVVAKDDRKVRIEVGYGLEGAIPDIAAGRVIQEYMVPKFRQDDYAGGVVDATAQLVRLVEGEPLPEPVASNPIGVDRTADFRAALVAAFVAALLMRGLFGKRTSAGVRGLFTAAVAGGAAWFVSTMLVAAVIGGFLGLVVGLMAASAGRFARDGSWGGWSASSSGDSSGGGGGWSGGGGSSGGGGASGSW